MRELDKLNVADSLREYKVDLDDLAAIKVANQIGLPPDQVFKTLCAKADDGEIVFSLVPAGAELDLKALARLAAPEDYVRSTAASCGVIARKCPH